jgi:hypothetical protein
VNAQLGERQPGPVDGALRDAPYGSDCGKSRNTRSGRHIRDKKAARHFWRWRMCQAFTGCADVSKDPRRSADGPCLAFVPYADCE